MRLAQLEATSREIQATPARSRKAGLLAALLRQLEPQEIDVAVAYLSGHLRQGRIGLGPAAVRAAADEAAAQEPTLGLLDVDRAFERLAGLSGAGSSGERVRQLAELLRRTTPPEASFLIRLILGELRQGALAGVMEEAVAAATGISASEIRRAAMVTGDLEAVARAALIEGRPGLAAFRLELFRPLQPMLAQPADSMEDALQRLGEAALEYKLDGARIQVHRSGSEVRVFSRRLNDVTPAVPELVETVRAFPARELILDGEVIALRPDGAPHPFQVTMRRFGRRLDVARMQRELPLTPCFFDLLRLDGEDRFDAPLRERSTALRAVAGDVTVTGLVTSDLAAAAAFYEQALDRGHEGVMAKALDAPYEAGSRGFNWLKVKAAHTLDLVVLAVEWGNGRRQGWLSNIHLGALDPATGSFVMLGKTFKGMTDEMLAWQTKRFQELEVSTDGYTVHVRPEQVVEVAFNDVQHSPHYPAGMALRFARVKRYRDDKAADHADTVETVRAILDRRGS
ncbi:MAG TPA: ATP-dependent DNA ligase [Candidatus Limnocylindria bacterium]|nr:ATP-dependent DNA ligase [Candidatus Limnocylindria bacterium]